MSGPSISEADIDAALTYLTESALLIGAARERLVRAEHMVKHIRAIEMKRHALMPVNAQEREAISSVAYHNAIMEEALAAGEFEKLKALREANIMKIEAWQTMSANYRGMRI